MADALASVPDDEPLHVARFGTRFDAQGVIAGSRDANRCIGYLTKYLTKHVANCHQAQTPAQHQHAERLADTLRYEPCSPTCANWLRYGVQPKNPRPGLRPGHCKGKAHRRERLGYAGRRVLVSRKWSGKTLADHGADRRHWLITTLGLPATDPARYTWEPVTPGDPDHMPNTQRFLHVVADRQRWHAALTEARARASGQPARTSGNREGSVMASDQSPDRLLTVEAAAERLSTSVRFVRRLIAERRIEFVKIGRHVRISEAALAEFIESGRIEPMTAAHVRPTMKGVA